MTDDEEFKIIEDVRSCLDDYLFNMSGYVAADDIRKTIKDFEGLVNLLSAKDREIAMLREELKTLKIDTTHFKPIMEGSYAGGCWAMADIERCVNCGGAGTLSGKCVSCGEVTNI